MHDAPVIENVVVTHHSKEAKRSKALPALVDTGADVSTIPKSMVNDIEIEATKKGKIVKTAEGSKLEPFYRVCFIVCGSKIQTEFAILGSENIIKLGRDVLQHSTLRVCWAR